mmetsp:Transcript_115804/g.328186  ORF Transcript_115804/g.328186 Transcript_115804/m.328186 type:complete len:557 (+) Transcript_115804:38-1708(+)
MVTTTTTSLPAVANVTEDELSTEELLRDAETAFGEVFSVRAPRDVFAGLWGGAKCILSGVLLGFASVIMQPVEGLRDNGAVGCARGIAVGLCSGLLFSVTGVCTGLFQAIRGMLATPRAVCMAQKGWRWDQEEATWAEPRAYSLPEEAAKVVSDVAGEDDEDEDEAASASRRRVVDTYYYDQLGVSPAASQREIRRAYFQRSRQWHPDKTSQPKAKERFQMISEAYQVLSDLPRRRAYDAQGREGAGEGFVDAQVFFSVLLGANALEPYIGRLRLAEMFGEELFGGGKDSAADADSIGDLSQQLRDMEKSDVRQVRRQVRLAVDLAERLDSCSSQSSAGFQEAACKEARDMLQKDASIERFVMEVGWVYRNRAERYLARQESRFGAFGVRALHLQLRGRGREARQQANTARLAVRSFLQLRKIANETDDAAAAQADAADDEAEMPAVLADALPTFMETFWSLSAHDIAGTLDKVLERVLSDSSVDAAGRRRRAERLCELGGAFVAEAEACRASAAAPAAAGGRAGAGPGGGSNNEQKCQRFFEAFSASMGAGAPAR